MLKEQVAISWMGLALFAITRPILSTARDVPLPRDSGGHILPHTFLRPGVNTGCTAYTFQGNYRWICEDNPNGDDRNEPIIQDENGMYKFTVYYGWTASDQEMRAPDMDTPSFYGDYELVSHWGVLYTTRQNCLASPPTEIVGWNIPDSSYTVEPCPATKYTGNAMVNPWAKNRQQMDPNLKSQAPAQGDSNADAVESSNYQLSSLKLDPDVAPLGIDSTISPPDSRKDTNPNNVVAELSYPGLNTPSLNTAGGGNFAAPSDFNQGGEFKFWQKEKRNSRAFNQRRRRVVTE